MSMPPSPDDTLADTPMLSSASSAVKVPPASYRDMGDVYRPLHLPSPLPSNSSSKRIKSEYMSAHHPIFEFVDEVDKVPYVIDQNSEPTEQKNDVLDTDLKRKGIKKKDAEVFYDISIKQPESFGPQSPIEVERSSGQSPVVEPKLGTGPTEVEPSSYQFNTPLKVIYMNSEKQLRLES